MFLFLSPLSLSKKKKKKAHLQLWGVISKLCLYTSLSPGLSYGQSSIPSSPNSLQGNISSLKFTAPSMASIHATDALPWARRSGPSPITARTRFQALVKNERLHTRDHRKDWATAMATQPSVDWPSSPTSWSDSARVSRAGLSACSHFCTAPPTQALQESAPALPEVSRVVQADP